MLTCEKNYLYIIHNKGNITKILGRKIMKLFNLKSKKAAKGFTLIEILLVVGFIALAGLGVYIVYNKVSAGGAANTESRNLDTLRAGTKTLFGGSSNYAKVTNLVLNQGRVTPDSMRAVPYSTTDASINNSFGGAVDVTPVTLGTGAASNGFAIKYTKVPGAVCSKLVTTGGTSFDQILVGTTPVKAFGTNNLDIGALTGGCAADTGAGVDIIFQSL